MCRLETQRVCARIDDLRRAGASRVVAVVKEDIKDEVERFREEYWTVGDLFLDTDKRFFHALHGGSAKPAMSTAGFLAMILNPFSKHRTKGAVNLASAEGVTGNMVGEGFITGGVYVVRRDERAAYTFFEEAIGDHAPIDDVIEGVRAAVRGEVYSAVPASLQPDGSRRSWKEWAGRTSGLDGYQIGDITRGLAGLACRRSRT